MLKTVGNQCLNLKGHDGESIFVFHLQLAEKALVHVIILFYIVLAMLHNFYNLQ